MIFHLGLIQSFPSSNVFEKVVFALIPIEHLYRNTNESIHFGLWQTIVTCKEIHLSVIELNKFKQEALHSSKILHLFFIFNTLHLPNCNYFSLYPIYN